MTSPRRPGRAALVAVSAAALLAGAVAAVRVAPLGPSLEIEVLRRFHTESQDVYDVTVTPRGGEVLDEVRIDVLRGSARVSPPGRTAGLGPDARFRARVTVAASTAVPGAVRVSMRGRVSRVYDVELAEAAR